MHGAKTTNNAIALALMMVYEGMILKTVKVAELIQTGGTMKIAKTIVLYKLSCIDKYL